MAQRRLSLVPCGHTGTESFPPSCSHSLNFLSSREKGMRRNGRYPDNLKRRNVEYKGPELLPPVFEKTKGLETQFSSGH